MKTNIFIHIIIGVFLYSCGSSQKSAPELTKSEIEKELESLTNDDFKPVRQIRYNESADYHIIKDLVDDALKDETLAKIDNLNINRMDDQLSSVVGLCYLGKSTQGLSELDKLYPKYKENPSYWNQLASCYLKNGELRKAKIFFHKAIAIDKSYIPAINNLGVVYLKEKKDEKAVAAFRQAISLKSDTKTPQYNLANLYIRYGLMDEAQSILQGILKADGKDKDVLLSLAYTSLYKLDGQSALSYLSRVPNEYLSRADFSLALLMSYKILKSDNLTKVSNFLSNQKLNSTQKRAFEKIMGLSL